MSTLSLVATLALGKECGPQPKKTGDKKKWYAEMKVWKKCKYPSKYADKEVNKKGENATFLKAKFYCCKSEDVTKTPKGRPCSEVLGEFLKNRDVKDYEGKEFETACKKDDKDAEKDDKDAETGDEVQEKEQNGAAKKKAKAKKKGIRKTKKEKKGKGGDGKVGKKKKKKKKDNKQ